jgi:hypothetical protein
MFQKIVLYRYVYAILRSLLFVMVIHSVYRSLVATFIAVRLVCCIDTLIYEMCLLYYSAYINVRGTRRSIVGSGGFVNLPNSSSRTMVLGSTQPLTKMSIRNLPGDKRRPARRADNLTAICELNV